MPLSLGLREIQNRKPRYSQEILWLPANPQPMLDKTRHFGDHHCTSQFFNLVNIPISVGPEHPFVEFPYRSCFISIPMGLLGLQCRFASPLQILQLRIQLPQQPLVLRPLLSLRRHRCRRRRRVRHRRSRCGGRCGRCWWR